MDGGMVFERVREVNPNARVLLITACDDVVAKKLFERGLRGYIQKPFYLNQLARQIHDVIES
jgi:DNA-binding response OmpR family regulator